MSPRVSFYNTPPEGRWPTALRMIEAAARKGTTIIVHCADRREARAFDGHLWTFRDEAFLPHELANSPEELRDAEARVVIVTTEARPIAAKVLFQLTPASPAFAQGFETVLDLVDNRDPALLQASRERFKAWRAAGVQPDHWRMDHRGKPVAKI